jgi:hypothetical protein
MKNERNYGVVAELTVIKDRMSKAHWKNPELFKLKLRAASKRFQEQFGVAD